MIRDLKWFDSLSNRDFENGAVIDEISEVFKENSKMQEKIKDIQQACHDCYEVYAGMEEPIPETACERYLLDRIYEMRDEIKKHKE